MRFYHRKHEVPQLNTTSTADISFMLLIFFLVTTNMDVDKGLTRQLPAANNQTSQESFVAKGTMLELKITADNQLLADGKHIAVKQLRNIVEKFVTRVGKGHLIKVDVDPAACYNIYFEMQNQLVSAYRHLRDSKARQQYGRAFAQLTSEQRDAIKDEIPQRIAEQYNGQEQQGGSAQ